MSRPALLRMYGKTSCESVSWGKTMLVAVSNSIGEVHRLQAKDVLLETLQSERNSSLCHVVRVVSAFVPYFTHTRLNHQMLNDLQ
jgi:hypothetical protein